MNFRLAPLALAALLATTACENMNGIGPKQGFGTLGGAAAGGLLGSKVGNGSGKLAATAAGTLLGALLGNEIGLSLDRADQLYYNRAYSQAYTAPIGSAVPWQSPNTGNYGYIEPTREGRDAYGSYCREFVQTAYIGGRAQQVTGSACQQPDGTWRIQS